MKPHRIGARVGRSVVREVLLAQLETAVELRDIELPSSRHILLLAADLVTPPLDRGQLASDILDSGCVYYCGWGLGSSAMDDLIDEEHAMRTLDSSSDGVIMTTWHEDSLEEAVDFALRHAEPVDEYAEGCECILLAVVGKVASVQQLEQIARPYLAASAI